MIALDKQGVANVVSVTIKSHSITLSS